MKKLIGAALGGALSLTAALPALAQPTNGYFGSFTPEAAGLGSETDFPTIIAGIINTLLGFLGVIAVLIILYSGFKWMTAGGNDKNVEEARKMLIYGVIGLVIILSAYGIASFVLDQLSNATA
ncbi:TrbC/VirB2 family protein [Candidatus Uhrbacteria bacterium]|nr:TrbC/VirB2 family protein [Candidatus Uhrbacteria bacterium]